jgi:hypothetical protein
LQEWEKTIAKAKTVGYVWVNVEGKPLADRMSMLYHGLQIAASTNRRLFVDRTRFAPLELPEAIEHSQSSMIGDEIQTDHTFACIDVSDRQPKILFQGASWPQALYIHPTISPWLRKHFGYHAAYFMGNYLFGTIKPPGEECQSGDPVDAVEGFQYSHDLKILPPEQFGRVLGRCGIDAEQSVFVLSADAQVPKEAKQFLVLDTTSTESQVCGLRQLMSAKRIIHTFGSRLGFWATAMQGSAGGFVNPLDNICVNMSNSQQGSLWHTYCPKECPMCTYRTNSRLYVCGSDIGNVKSYIEYLLW